MLLLVLLLHHHHHNYHCSIIHRTFSEQNVSEEKDKDDKAGEDELPEGTEQIGEEMEEEGDEKQEETEATEKLDLADAEGGGSKDEEKTGDDPKVESEKEVEEETAKPSEDHPTDAPAEAAAEMDQTYGSKDKVSALSTLCSIILKVASNVLYCTVSSLITMIAYT